MAAAAVLEGGGAAAAGGTRRRPPLSLAAAAEHRQQWLVRLFAAGAPITKQGGLRKNWLPRLARLEDAELVYYNRGDAKCGAINL
jgi:hypothetical protein